MCTVVLLLSSALTCVIQVPLLSRYSILVHCCTSAVDTRSGIQPKYKNIATCLGLIIPHTDLSLRIFSPVLRTLISTNATCRPYPQMNPCPATSFVHKTLYSSSIIRIREPWGVQFDTVAVVDCYSIPGFIAGLYFPFPPFLLAPVLCIYLVVSVHEAVSTHSSFLHELVRGSLVGDLGRSPLFA